MPPWSGAYLASFLCLSTVLSACPSSFLPTLLSPLSCGPVAPCASLYVPLPLSLPLSLPLTAVAVLCVCASSYRTSTGKKRRRRRVVNKVGQEEYVSDTETEQSELDLAPEVQDMIVQESEMCAVARPAPCG